MALHQEDGATAMMTVAAAASVTTLIATVDPAAMTVVTADMAAVTVTTTPHVESTAMVDAMTATDVEVMTAVAEVADIQTVTIVATAQTVVEIAMVGAHPVMQHHQPPMVTQPLAEMLGSHTEVDTSMMRNTPIVAIDR